MKVAEVLATINFENGQQAVFTVSPGGQLSPSKGDAQQQLRVELWQQAATALVSLGLRPPSGADCVKLGNGLAWPWNDNEQADHNDRLVGIVPPADVCQQCGNEWPHCECR